MLGAIAVAAGVGYAFMSSTRRRGSRPAAAPERPTWTFSTLTLSSTPQVLYLSPSRLNDHWRGAASRCPEPMFWRLRLATCQARQISNARSTGRLKRTPARRASVLIWISRIRSRHETHEIHEIHEKDHCDRVCRAFVSFVAIAMRSQRLANERFLGFGVRSRSNGIVQPIALQGGVVAATSVCIACGRERHAFDPGAIGT